MADDFDIVMELGNLPQDFCPKTYQELLNALAEYARFTLSADGSLTLINFGPEEPDFNNRDKPWERTSIDGKPLGTYVFFNGRWVKAYPYEPGQILKFSGAKVTLDAMDAFVFCDGDNATPNLVPDMDPAVNNADEYNKAFYMYTGYDT